VHAASGTHRSGGYARWALPLIAVTSTVGLLAQAAPATAGQSALASSAAARTAAQHTRDQQSTRYLGRDHGQETSPTLSVAASPTTTGSLIPAVSVSPSPTTTGSLAPAVSVSPSPTKTGSLALAVSVSPSPTTKSVPPRRAVSASASPTTTVSPRRPAVVLPKRALSASPSPTTSTSHAFGGRLFASSSSWNTVKRGIAYAPAADGTLHGLSYGINNGAYDHPTYFAKATDPMTTFHLGAGWGFPATTMTVPAPAGMKASTGGDLVMTILLSNGQILDLYGVSGSGTSFRASYYGISNGVNGSGFGTNGHAVGTTAIGSPQAGGTILARDVAAGSISHALCMAFDYSVLGGLGTGGRSVYPAVSNDDGGGGGPLPEGGLLLIPAGTVKPAGLSSMGSALWNAAATYGVYVTDQLSGGPMFYGDGSSAVGSAFNSGDFNAVGKALRLAKTW